MEGKNQVMSAKRVRFRKAAAWWMAVCVFMASAVPVYAAEEIAVEENAAQESVLSEEDIQQSAPLEELFPDVAFREYIAREADTDQDGFLSRQEAEQVTELLVSGLGITSLQGISSFSNLRILDCSDNYIGALDLKGLEHLYAFTCENNRIVLSVNEAGQVDFTGVQDMDCSRILEVSQGTWIGDGLLQLSEDFRQETFSYTYSAAESEEGVETGEFWKIEIAVVLDYGSETKGPDADETAVSGNGLSENSAKEDRESQGGAEPAAKKSQPAAGNRDAVNESVRVMAKKSYPAKIKSCKILGDKSRVQVKAKVSRKVKSKDSYYYLFALSPKNNKLSKPAAKVKKTKNITFTVPLNYNKAGSRLMCKFLVAVKSGKKYTAVSGEKYISNPEKMASSSRAFTKGKSKKGLQFGESLPDAVSLGVNYCLFNINITEFTQKGGQQLKYNYKGKNYYFNQSAFDRWGSLFSQLQSNKMNLSAEFLLPWEAGQTELIHPAARRKTSAHYYAWNISTKAAREKYEALFSCIAEQFDGGHGRGYINNYIIGNEVNAYSQWHYTGSTSLKTNANLYADTYELVYMAVKSKCKNARVSICLTHTWNVSTAGQFHSSRSFLDQFAVRLKEYGNTDFTIAYHAYSQPLLQTEFWKNSPQQVTNSVNSPFITMKNIEYLTKYVKSKYGSKTRIMLTEQGFSSHGSGGEKKQAAAIAYAYYKAEFNDMIDCIIFRCQADSQVEINSDNLHMGLWTVGMGKKKAAYDVFQYMDTSKGESYTKSCRKHLGITKWSVLVPGYKSGRFR